MNKVFSQDGATHIWKAQLNFVSYYQMTPKSLITIKKKKVYTFDFTPAKIQIVHIVYNDIVLCLTRCVFHTYIVKIMQLKA